MASPRTRRVLQDLRADKSNTRCFECGAHNPQWASVSLAIWICLECSGKHRSIGVHLSFVRSLTMDKWKESELEKMKVGGNKHAREFLDSQDDWDDSKHITLKYNCRAAALLRDKIKTESEGRVWSAADCNVRSSAGVTTMHKSASTPLVNSGATTDNTRHNRYQGSYQSADYSQHDGDYQQNACDAKEAFFARKQAENAMRSEHLAPSQGGRYSGFGNTVTPAARSNNNSDVMDSALQSLTNGWSLLSMGATKMARSATESALKLSSTASDLSTTFSEKIREGKMGDELLSQAHQMAGKVGDFSRRGYDQVQSWVGGGHNPAIQYEPANYSAVNSGATAQHHRDNSAAERTTLLTSGGQSGKHSFGSSSPGGYQQMADNCASSGDTECDQWGSGAAWNDTHLAAPLTAAARERGAGAAKKTATKNDAGAANDFKNWEDEAWESLTKK